MTSTPSITEVFREAVARFEDEPFYRSTEGITLATQWMALSAEVLDWSTLNTDRVQIDNMAYLASRYDIAIVKPYYDLGITDHLAIERFILGDIDAELASKL